MKNLEKEAWKLLDTLNAIRPDSHSTFKSYEDKQHEAIIEAFKRIVK